MRKEKRKKKRDNIPLKNIDRCQNGRGQKEKTGGRKRGKRRDVDVRNGREMVAGWSRDGRGIDP